MTNDFHRMIVVRYSSVTGMLVAMESDCNARREAKFRVAICGAGIGGLALALILRDSACAVDLYESESEITSVGAGITLFARATEIMQHLGLLDELSCLAINPPLPNTGPYFRKGFQAGDNAWFQRVLNIGPLQLHRRDLIDALLRRIPQTTSIHFKKKLVSWAEDVTVGRVLLTFADGTTAETDVLVGADGIGSVTRKCMYQHAAEKHEKELDGVPSPLRRFIDPLWTGLLAYRSLIPTENLSVNGVQLEAVKAKLLTYFTGKGQHIVTYPISQGRFLNVVVYLSVPNAFDTPIPPGRWGSDVEPGEIEELKKAYSSWEPEAQTIVQSLEQPTRWATSVVRKLPFFVSGSVAILGDAAHAMEPHLGAGAAQAIEDAFILGRLLAHEGVSKDSIRTALRVYESVRLPFSQEVRQKSQNLGRLLQYRSPANDGTYLPHDCSDDFEAMKTMIEDVWEWQNKGGTLLEWEVAERKLEELLSKE